MKLLNTQTGKKEEIKGPKIGMYVCGPTVYSRAHIGNLRAYINADVLKKALLYLGYSVKHVMNITDVEDKIIKKSIETGKNYTEITKEYEKLFWKDMKSLNIAKPDVTPHATDSKVIVEMVKIIEGLLDKNYAYIAEDNSIYFSVSKFNSYGKLSHLDKKGIIVGKRCAVDEYDKENPRDFALWKAVKDNEPSWKGPKGVVGRPGWHIECSAMSMMNLGETIDIHAGGVDNIFPHHENEIAQSEAYTGKQFVKHWFHGEHLLVNGKKMSKSLGNLYTLDDLSNKFNVEPAAFRLLCLQSHYRDKLNFTERSIVDAQNTLANLRNFVNRINQTSGKKNMSRIVKRAEKKFEKALSDDLNTSEALAAIFEFTKEVNKTEDAEKKAALDFIGRVDEVLGLDLKPDKFDNKVEKLFSKYLTAKKSKDYEKSDKLRKEIEGLGWVPEDSQYGSALRKK